MSLAFSGTIFLEYLLVRVRAAGADGTIRLVVPNIGMVHMGPEVRARTL